MALNIEGGPMKGVRPGGVGRYSRRLRTLGMDGVTVRNLGWRKWWSGPWLATRLLSATKTG